LPKQTEPAAFKEKFVMVRVTEDLKKRFENICKKNFQNQSELLRRWMTNYIERGDPSKDAD